MFDIEHIQKTYIKLALPLVIGMIISLVYNITDTFFIARTGNISLIAGVSVCVPLFTTLMAFGNIFGQGGSSLISRLLGSGDKEGAARISSFCFYGAIAIGILSGILLLIFCDPILRLIGASDQVLPYAKSYYIVLALGAPLCVLSFIHSNLVRCEGMATQAMIGSILGSVTNIILDPILIFGCNLGAQGAAIATVLGYVASVLYFLILVIKKSQCLSVDIRKVKIPLPDMTQIFAIGTTAAITNIMQSLCTIIVNQFLLPYGDSRIAAMGMVMKVNMIAQLILVGFAFGGVPLFGYLFGADNKEKLKELIRFCITLMGGLAVLFTFILFVFAGPIMHIFASDPDILAICIPMLRWQTIGSVFVAVVLLTTVLFQATGKVLPAFLMSISRQGIVFLLVLIISTSLFQYQGVLMAQAISDFVSMIIGLILYYICFLR